MMPMEQLEVTASSLEIERDGGKLFAYHAAPSEKARTSGTVVLAMHLWGVDASMRDAADRFARAGIATVVPDLYSHLDVPSGDGENDPARFIPFARSLSETVEADIAAAEGWLRETYPRRPVGIAGFCMGGVVALRRTLDPKRFAAAAVWYGSLANVDPSSAAVPIVASFGGADSGIPSDAVDAFRKGLRIPHDVVLYPGAMHGFCDVSRDTYEPRAAEDSWVRVLSFLAKHFEAHKEG
jgi:carboxymethylenebutenolidase